MSQYSVLVLCTGNSCRSQMAQGFINYYGGEHVHAVSAGIEAHGVNRKAIQVMEEIGIDISHHTSNIIDDYLNLHFDLVLTVCDHAKENCPYYPNTKRSVHHNFLDPAKAVGSDEEVLESFRSVRDEIGRFCFDLLNDYRQEEEE